MNQYGEGPFRAIMQRGGVGRTAGRSQSRTRRREAEVYSRKLGAQHHSRQPGCWDTTDDIGFKTSPEPRAWRRAILKHRAGSRGAAPMIREILWATSGNKSDQLLAQRENPPPRRPSRLLQLHQGKSPFGVPLREKMHMNLRLICLQTELVNGECTRADRCRATHAHPRAR
jgi:hypothetical protein